MLIRPAHIGGLCALLSLSLLSACSSPSGLDIPASPEQPWKANSAVWSLQRNSAASADDASFSVPSIPQLTNASAELPVSLEQPLDLPQLIDLAQRNNPTTRLAWNHAREAALTVGLTDALFLPVITANVISGEQRLRVPVELPLNLGRVDVDSTVRGTVPFVTLAWLLFDFGEREATREGAQYLALASNVLFNAAHQKLIRDVTDAYYRYNAARHNVALAAEALEQHEYVLRAVDARFKQGLATRIDIALAEQAVAQGKLNWVTHQGTERTSYLALTDAMGLPASTPLQIAASQAPQLPAAITPITQQRIDDLIAQRPDIAAAYAAVKAAEAGRRRAEAAFLPKVYMGAGWASNHSDLQIGGVSANLQNTASGVMVGISMPLYDGGLRSKQLSKADVSQEMAQQRLEQLQLTAAREIIGVEQALQTALQAHDAAQELVRTTRVTYSAALAAYQVGRASTVLLTETALQLNKAQQVQADAQYAAIASAANLAFAMGTMVSAQNSWWPQQHAVQLP